MSIQDMADLLYIYDAYRELNNVMFGSEIILGLHEGNFGTFTRIYNLIERNAAEELKKNNYERVWEIANDQSLSPEERAKTLLN